MEWNSLKADTVREYGRFSWIFIFTGLLTHRTFRVIILMRLCQILSNSYGILKFFSFFLKRFYSLSIHIAGMDISWKTEVGAGVAMPHGWGIVINPSAKIGKNVTLFHGVTLGRRDRIFKDETRQSEYPIIEDEVWIGPHAIIVGGVTIGRGSRIAGGAFVTTNIPPYSIVVGNPSNIVKSDCIPDVVNRAHFN
jgi:serine O-acetyltransferase